MTGIVRPFMSDLLTQLEIEVALHDLGKLAHGNGIAIDGMQIG